MTANNAQCARTPGKIASSGRGAGTKRDGAIIQPDVALTSKVLSYLRGVDGVRVTEAGRLARSNGHPRGTAWVEIEADSVLDCEMAELRLASLDELKPAAWADGWSLAENHQGETSLRLKLYS